MFSSNDLSWMRHTIELAKRARLDNEVPIGAVLILDNHLLAEGWNCPISHCDPTAHAEIIALRQGAIKQNNYRLINTTLYVSLEPCMMCVGAITQARVKRVVFGAYDKRQGAVESRLAIKEFTSLNHQAIYQGGLLADECGAQLTEFFREKRSV